MLVDPYFVVLWTETGTTNRFLEVFLIEPSGPPSFKSQFTTRGDSTLDRDYRMIITDEKKTPVILAAFKPNDGTSKDKIVMLEWNSSSKRLDESLIQEQNFFAQQGITKMVLGIYSNTFMVIGMSHKTSATVYTYNKICDSSCKSCYRESDPTACYDCTPDDEIAIGNKCFLECSVDNYVFYKDLCKPCNPLDLKCENCDTQSCLKCSTGSEVDTTKYMACKCILGYYLLGTGQCEDCN